jgi:glutamate racemase
VIPLIQEIVGGKVRVIDPAPAVAKQVKRRLEAGGMKNESVSKGSIKSYTSGHPTELKSLLPVLLGEDGVVEKVGWIDDAVIAPTRA